MEVADGILVNAIAPGPILAPDDTGDAELKAVAESTHSGAGAAWLQIAKAVVAIIDSDFITGETVRVDGGRHVRCSRKLRAFSGFSRAPRAAILQFQGARPGEGAGRGYVAVTTTHPHTAFRESPERRAEGSRRPVRILLVEDDDDVRLLLTLVLKRAGYEVSATANADQALQALHRGRHEFDPHRLLPAEERRTGVPGGSALRRPLAGAPVILCTAFPPNRLSGVTVVEKPIDLDALLQQIRAALKR